MDGTPGPDPGGTSMHLEASRLAKVTPLPVRSPATPPAPTIPGRFAEVYDLAAERERRSPPPPEAIAAVDEARRVYREIDAAGLQVRLDLTRGFSAQLRAHDGMLVRALTLREVVDPSGLLPPDAA